MSEALRLRVIEPMMARWRRRSAGDPDPRFIRYRTPGTIRRTHLHLGDVLAAGRRLWRLPASVWRWQSALRVFDVFQGIFSAGYRCGAETIRRQALVEGFGGATASGRISQPAIRFRAGRCGDAAVCSGVVAASRMVTVESPFGGGGRARRAAAGGLLAGERWVTPACWPSTRSMAGRCHCCSASLPDMVVLSLSLQVRPS